MLSFKFLVPVTMQSELGLRCKALRLHLNWRRETLAKASGVPAISIRRFESKGEISLKSLLKIAHALGALDQFQNIFTTPPAKNIAELEKIQQKPKTQRGRQ